MKCVCLECKVEMKPEATGLEVVETLEDGVTPYKIWNCDVKRCPRCGWSVYTGFGVGPTSQQGQDGFVAKAVAIPRKYWWR